jgi:hypothetical protein
MGTLFSFWFYNLNNFWPTQLIFCEGLKKICATEIFFSRLNNFCRPN